MFVLIAINAANTAVVYTGRAGVTWVSGDMTEAFVYENSVRAAAVAANFNRMTVLHGLTFNVERR